MMRKLFVIALLVGVSSQLFGMEQPATVGLKSSDGQVFTDQIPLILMI